MVECAMPMASQISCAEAKAFCGSWALMWAETTVRPSVKDHTWRQWRSVTPLATHRNKMSEGGIRIAIYKRQEIRYNELNSRALRQRRRSVTCPAIDKTSTAARRAQAHSTTKAAPQQRLKRKRERRGHCSTRASSRTANGDGGGQPKNVLDSNGGGGETLAGTDKTHLAPTATTRAQ